jgi:hypothetical protein
MLRAILWTPDDLVRLDLEPLLARERRRLAGQDARLARSRAPLVSQARRTAALVAELELLVAEARLLPAHDAAAAKAWIESLERRAMRAGRRWPGWLAARVAEHAAWRLLPHVVTGRAGPAGDPEVRARVAVLRARGMLRLLPGPPEPPRPRPRQGSDAPRR